MYIIDRIKRFVSNLEEIKKKNDESGKKGDAPKSSKYHNHCYEKNYSNMQQRGIF